MELDQIKHIVITMFESIWPVDFSSPDNSNKLVINRLFNLI